MPSRRKLIEKLEHIGSRLNLKTGYSYRCGIDKDPYLTINGPHGEQLVLRPSLEELEDFEIGVAENQLFVDQIRDDAQVVYRFTPGMRRQSVVPLEARLRAEIAQTPLPTDRLIQNGSV